MGRRGVCEARAGGGKGGGGGGGGGESARPRGIQWSCLNDERHVCRAYACSVTTIIVSACGRCVLHWPHCSGQTTRLPADSVHEVPAPPAATWNTVDHPPWPSCQTVLNLAQMHYRSVPQVQQILRKHHKRRFVAALWLRH